GGHHVRRRSATSGPPEGGYYVRAKGFHNHYYAVAPRTLSAHARDQWRRSPWNSFQSARTARGLRTLPEVAIASSSPPESFIHRSMGNENPRFFAAPAISSSGSSTAPTSSGLLIPFAIFSAGRTPAAYSTRG